MTTTTTRPKAARNGTDPARDGKPSIVDLEYVETAKILPGANVRTELGDLEELTASIRERGVLQPISVREADQGDGTVFYELLIGHRRYAAAKAAGRSEIPALVYRGTAPKLSELSLDQLVENLQREDLNPLDEARAYRQLLDSGLSQRQLAEKLGKAQPTIAMALRLLKVPAAIQERVASGALSASHVKAIASLPDAEQEELARRAVEFKLSAHQVEEEVRLAQRRAAAADRARDEARNLADAAEAALAKKKGATKETARLQVYDGQLAAELKQRGWTLVDRFVGYGRPKGCDCVAFTVAREYMGDRQGQVRLTEGCVQQAHVDAAQAAREAEWKREQEQQRKEREAEKAAAAQETSAIVAHFAGGRWGTTDDWRCILAALWQQDPWGFDEIVERNLPADQVEDWEADDDSIWRLASQLDSRALMAEFGRFMAESIQGEARAKLLELAKASAKAKAKG